MLIKDNMARDIDTTNGVHTQVALMLDAIANKNAFDRLKFKLVGLIGMKTRVASSPKSALIRIVRSDVKKSLIRRIFLN